MSIPKRHILIVDSDPDRTCELRFLLRTWITFAVDVVDCPAGLLAIDATWPELVIADASFPQLAELLPEMHSRFPFARILVLAATEFQTTNLIADGYLSGIYSKHELRDRVIFMLRRKRGPKKPVVSARPEIEAARRLA
jgi:DNA-binding response OmpR family regulator